MSPLWSYLLGLLGAVACAAFGYWMGTDAERTRATRRENGAYYQGLRDGWADRTKSLDRATVLGRLHEAHERMQASVAAVEAVPPMRYTLNADQKEADE